MQYANHSNWKSIYNCVFFSQLSCCFFAPFEAGISQGITRTRDFCEFCTTLPVPELSIFVLSVGYTQNHTRGIYRGYYPAKNFCNFCRTLILVPGTFGSSVRRYHKNLGYGYSMLIPARKFWEFCTPVPQYPEVLEVL